jgi:hypothetical protein
LKDAIDRFELNSKYFVSLSRDGDALDEMSDVREIVFTLDDRPAVNGFLEGHGAITEEHIRTILADCNLNNLNDIVTVKIPRSVTRISSGTFNGCQRLREVEFEEGSLLRVIDSDVFNDYPEMKIKIHNNDEDFINVIQKAGFKRSFEDLSIFEKDNNAPAPAIEEEDSVETDEGSVANEEVRPAIEEHVPAIEEEETSEASSEEEDSETDDAPASGKPGNDPGARVCSIQ